MKTSVKIKSEIFQKSNVIEKHPIEKIRFLLVFGSVVTIVLYGMNQAQGSEGAKVDFLHPIYVEGTVSQIAQTKGKTCSLRKLPLGTVLDPHVYIHTDVGNRDELCRGVESSSCHFKERQAPLSKTSGSSNIRGTAKDQQLFIDETSFRLPAVVDCSADAEFSDVDGDGDLDLFIANTDGEQNRLFINDGHGIFFDETRERLPVDRDFSLGVEFGDVDGDGDLDMFIANNFAFQLPACDLISGQNRLLLNNGEGVFSDETDLRLPESIAASTDAKFFDADGDGDLDVVITNCVRPGDCVFLGGGQLQILMNDSRGFFTDETYTRLPNTLHTDVSLDIGDIDGDSDFDLVVADPYDQNRILVNDGSGVFTDQSFERFPTLIASTRDLILLDADDDGDFDIFCANDSSLVWPGQTVAQNRLLVNNGYGIFTDETDTRLPLAQDMSMGGADAGDVDGDGDLDVIVANNKLMSEGRQNRLLLNGGSGIFGDEITSALPTVCDISADVILGDVTGDGVLDVFVANYGEQNFLLIGISELNGGPEEPEILMGDVTIDGVINVLDVLTTVNHILGNAFLNEDGLYRADCNGDAQVNILDALGVVNVILGIGECSPGGCKAQVTQAVMDFFKTLEPYMSEADFVTLFSLIHTESTIPVEYCLSQNYPNPFNPETRIDYQLPESEFVTLTVFNTLGQSVRTLVEEEQQAGIHTHVWDGCDDSGRRVASGVYFFQLKAGDFMSSKKMLLTK